MAGGTNWISVGELGTAFGRDPNLLPESAGLVGRAFTLYFEKGWAVEIRFADTHRLARTPRHGEHNQCSLEGDVEYSAVEIRPDVYFVNFVEPRQSASTGSLLLDLSRGVCTAVLGQLPTQAQARIPLMERIKAGVELTSVSATLLSATIDTPWKATAERHESTADLIGKHVEYTYSPTERYEHIYLNDKYYTWHCLEGSEQGLADTDRCHYRKLGEQLYLFVWAEKIVPTLGIVVVDLRQLRTTGRILGYSGFDFGTIANFPVGAKAKVLSPA